jgi:hypothetical protein
VRKEDDLELLASERELADREYNEALTRLDRAIQSLPASFPHPPPSLDEQQVTPLNTLWEIQDPQRPEGGQGMFAAAVQRAVAPLVARQQAFNSALVDHINRNVPVDRQTRESIAATLATLQGHIEGVAAFESLLVMFLQQITPYVDTRDRGVAGLLRGLSGAINAVADETMKRTEALLARERRHESRVAELEAEVGELRRRLEALQGRAGSAPTPEHA